VPINQEVYGYGERGDQSVDLLGVFGAHQQRLMWKLLEKELEWGNFYTFTQHIDQILLMEKFKGKISNYEIFEYFNLTFKGGINQPDYFSNEDHSSANWITYHNLHEIWKIYLKIEVFQI
jgi:hypothetical protein